MEDGNAHHRVICIQLAAFKIAFYQFVFLIYWRFTSVDIVIFANIWLFGIFIMDLAPENTRQFKPSRKHAYTILTP